MDVPQGARESEADSIAGQDDLGVIVGCLRQVIDALSLEHDFERFFQKAARSAADLVGADGAALILLNHRGAQEYQFFLGLPESFQHLAEGYTYAADQGLSGQVIGTRQSIFVGSYADHPSAMPDFVAAGLQADLLVPISAQGEVIGVLAVAWFERGVVAPDPERVRLVEIIAAQIGVASHRAELERELARRANHDALTGLASRRYFMECLHGAARSAQRNGGEFAVLLIDLDGFKGVNDRLGHAAGDELLRDVGRRLSTAVRASDVVARIGGDEFIVLAGYVKWPEEISALAQRILQALTIRLAVDGAPLTVAASIGIACYTGGSVDVELLLRQADMAMYDAKQQRGGRQHRFFDAAIEDLARQRDVLLTEVERALAEGEFVLNFQPVVDLSNGTVRSAEALLRWRQPGRQLRGAADFVPVLERHSHRLVRSLGRWVLHAAIQQLREWRDIGLTLPIAINISAHHFLDENFLPELQQELDQHPELAPSLILEITESSLLEDIERARELILAGQKLGLRFALDDFGTGYASLIYLKRLPVDIVKIDRSFIADMLASPGDRAIVEAILAMAKVLGVAVIAEGVEDLAQAQCLVALGCIEAQGFGLARPMAASELVSCVRAAEARATDALAVRATAAPPDSAAGTGAVRTRAAPAGPNPDD